MSLKILGVIPARYASTRFPGKPLIDIAGKSMICRVYEQACKAASLEQVWVATDDQRIFDHINGFGGNVIMTSDSHRTGTERCHEVMEKFEKEGKCFDVVINIQGDEPFIDPEQIDKVAQTFINPEIQIASLIKAITSHEELFSPNIIKVVTNKNGKAIYFSRSPIPFLRGCKEDEWLQSHVFYKHIGLYAFRSEVLRNIYQLPPSPLEIAESLEQLRWIENSFQIHVEITQTESHSIDTPEDLKKI